MIKNISVTKDYHECGRCKISTAVEYRLCPCNRKDCEAKKIGTITIMKTITLDSEDLSVSRDKSMDNIGQMMASMNL